MTSLKMKTKKAIGTTLACSILIWPLSGMAALLPNDAVPEAVLQPAATIDASPFTVSAGPNPLDGIVLAMGGGGGGGGGMGGGGMGGGGGEGLGSGNDMGSGTGGDSGGGHGTGSANGSGTGSHDGTGNGQGAGSGTHVPGTGLDN